MIYQLMKLNRAWAISFLIAGLIALLHPLLVHAFDDQYAAYIPLCIIAYIPARRYLARPFNLFEASLPIRAWEIFCARVLQVGALIGFSVLAMVVARLADEYLRFISHPWIGNRAVQMAVGGGNEWIAAKNIVAIGALFTVILLAPFCLRVMGFVRSITSQRIVSVFSYIALGTFIFVLMNLSLRVILTVCFVANAALIIWVRLRLPESFQIMPKTAPAELRQEPTPVVSRGSRTTGIFIWAPLIRALSSKSFMLWIYMLPMLFLEGFRIWPFWSLMLAVIFAQIHFHSSWLHTLPVSRHLLFALLLLPQLGMATGGYLIRLHFFRMIEGSQSIDIRMPLIAITGIFAGCLATIFCINSSWWYRLPRRLSVAVPTIYFLTLVSALIITLTKPSLLGFSEHTREPFTGIIMGLIADFLPHNMLAVTAIAIIFLGGLYWVVSRQFCELEMSTRSH